MAYNSDRLVHFTVGSVPHEHMLKMANAAAMPGIHSSRARESMKSGDATKASMHRKRESESIDASGKTRDSVKAIPDTEHQHIGPKGMKNLGNTTAAPGRNLHKAKGKPAQGQERSN